MEEASDFNKLLIHPSFRQIINDLNKLDIRLPTAPNSEELIFQDNLSGGTRVVPIEDLNKKIRLNARNGEKLSLSGKYKISAYDESINKFFSLGGTAFLVSHSLVLVHEKDFTPANFLKFSFYTRSKEYVSKSETKSIKFSDDPESDFKKDYLEDRKNFILKNTSKNSVIFIDGPLLAGNASKYTVELNNELLKNGIVPIFFVKNSASNLVIDYITALKGKYNSDLHWSYEFLKEGERTSFFHYVDADNKTFTKLFCYFKPFNLSPQRIEIYPETFKKYKNEIDNILDLIYYFTLVQGTLSNPQVRPIAIAEKYARDTINLIKIDSWMKASGVVPTMNQERFGGW